MVATMRKVQMRDIAKRVGVSASGVSRALRNDPRISETTRKRVHRVARDLGFAFVPRKTSANKVWQFGFVYCDPHATTFDDQGFGPALRVMMKDSSALRSRFELLLIDDDVREGDARQRLTEFARRLEGVLLYGTIHAPVLELLQQLNVPAVVIGECDVPAEAASAFKLQRVTDDPTRAGAMATEYLLQRGRRRIAFVSGIRQRGFYYDQWHRGFLLAHAEAGVPVDPHRVLWHKIGDPLRRHLNELVDPRVRPDAIVWPDASIAGELRPILHAQGLALAPADEVIASMEHLLEGQEQYPQVLTDLAALTREAVRRLHAICRQPPDTAATVVLPNILRNFDSTPPATSSRAHS